MSKFISKFLFNETVSIKTQLIVSFTAVVVASSAITLAICYGLLFQTVHTSYAEAEYQVLDNGEANVVTSCLQIADAIEQKMLVVGQSVCQLGALYAQSLLTYTSNNSSVLKKLETYREYNFVDGCEYPSCPEDYGPWNGRSRISRNAEPSLQNGSVSHSSVYLYSSRTNGAARSDSAWQAVINSNPNVSRVIDALAYQEIDFEKMYEGSYNQTLFFFSTAKVYNGRNYDVVHRTLPGVNYVASLGGADPSKTGWYKLAPVNSFNVDGPYLNKQANTFVLTVSSRQDYQDSGPDYSIELVTSSIILLDEFINIVDSITYANDGFGAVLMWDDMSVVTWKPGFQTYNYTSNKFLTLGEIEPDLLQYNLRNDELQFNYADSNGTHWVCASVPFLRTSEYGKKKTYSMILMLFYRKLELLKPLGPLRANQTETVNIILIVTLTIVLCATAIIVMLALYMAAYITGPLHTMRHISADLIRIAAEDDDRRNYSKAVKEQIFTLNRTDEIGALTSQYYQIIVLLNNKTAEKQKQPKYLPNPFYLNKVEDFSHMKWHEFMRHLEEKNKSPSDDPEAVDNLQLSFKLSANSRSFYKNVSFIDRSGKSQVDESDTVSDKKLMPMEIEGDDISGKRSGPSRNLSYADLSRRDSRKMEIVPLEAGPIEVEPFQSIKLRLYAVLALLLICLLVVMIITVTILNDYGNTWMDNSEGRLEQQQLESLSEIVTAKKTSTEAYFQQLTADLLTAAYFAHLVLNHNITYSNPLTEGHYLPSYSLNPDDPFAYDTDTSKLYYDKSGYFFPAAANCEDSSTCDYYNELNETLLTSLMDIKLSSYFYDDSVTAISQFGYEASGQLRNFPYEASTLYADPTNCLITSFVRSDCEVTYYNTKCGGGSTSYPAYDPRCRSWYGSGIENGNPNLAYFQYPRTSSAGLYVITGYTPIKVNQNVNGGLLGVINILTLVQPLVKSINKVKILNEGYTYVIDAEAVTNIIIHPAVSRTSDCDTVDCAEDFYPNEYDAFYNTVLLPLQNNVYITNSSLLQKVESKYWKRNRKWRLQYAYVFFGTVKYAVIATVPLSEILKPSRRVNKSISNRIDAMVAAFVIIIIVFTFTLSYAAVKFVNAIVAPINALREICSLVTKDDLTGSLPSNATSLDMKVLLDAFANLMVALRFGSEKYQRGDKHLALEAFKEAHQLFSKTGNLRGVSSALNNIGAVELHLKNYALAEESFKQSIAIGYELLKVAQEKKGSRSRLRRTISDRHGNLVIVYLEQNKFAEADAVLGTLIEEDKNNGYIMGLIIKQGTQGHFYLRQGDFTNAEKMFGSALQFVRCEYKKRNFAGKYSQKELKVAEQIALYNLSCLHVAKEDYDQAESLFLESLSCCREMSSTTSVKILIGLCDLFRNQGRKEPALQIMSLAEEYQCFASGISDWANFGPKRVVFVVDYSSSMAGEKIKATSRHLQNLFSKHIFGIDSLMLLHFNDKVHVDFNLTPKWGNIDMMKSTIKNLRDPDGSSALYDGIATALEALESSHEHTTSSHSNDWIVVFTDGDDNGSEIKHKTLMNILAESNVNLVIIGFGNDIEPVRLEELVGVTNKGKLILTNSRQRHIEDAFGGASNIIHGQVLLED